MTLAKTLLKLWRLRRWVALGVVVAAVAAVGSLKMSHSTVYASASTQLLVDSPNSALANASVDLTGYLDRASAFARMMTSAEALQYIGKAAGIPGNLIDATGPVEINGSPAASHAPVEVVGGKDVPAAPSYQLSFSQDPSLPTVDVNAEAPTTAQAIALANGAVTGLASFVSQLQANKVPQGERVVIRQLGAATGGMVDASAGKSIAILAFTAVFVMWCCLVLWITRLRDDLRAVRRHGQGHEVPVLTREVPPAATPTVGDDLPRFGAPVASGEKGDTNVGVNGTLSKRAWAITQDQSRP